MKNCSIQGCSATHNLELSKAVAQGWALHGTRRNEETKKLEEIWLCPTHLQKHDAPAILIAEKILEERKAANEALAKKIQDSVEKRANESRPVDPQDTEPAPAPDHLDSEG